MSDRQILDYIRANRARYTREAITQQLIAAGHGAGDVEAAWEAVAADQPHAGHAAQTERTIHVIAVIMSALGLVILVASVVGYAGVGGLGGLGWIALVLFVGGPVMWFSARRPLGALALLLFVVLLGPIGLLAIAGGAYLSSPGPFLWLALYVVGGAFLVRQAYRWNAPLTPLRWIGAVAGIAALVLLLAGGSCLASLPFLNL
jgi:hypothetical protein